jgi:hypothetical protein
VDPSIGSFVQFPIPESQSRRPPYRFGPLAILGVFFERIFVEFSNPKLTMHLKHMST